MSTKPKPLLHLLKPREFRVWCRPNDTPGNFGVTNLASKCTCANCLTAYRIAISGNYKPFKVSHVHPSREITEHGL